MTTPTDIAEVLPAPRSDDEMRGVAQPRPAMTIAADDALDLAITDDLPGRCPIGAAELEAIETYLADVLDMVLSGDKDAPSALHCHKRMR